MKNSNNTTSSDDPSAIRLSNNPQRSSSNPATRDDYTYAYALLSLSANDSSHKGSGSESPAQPLLPRISSSSECIADVMPVGDHEEPDPPAPGTPPPPLPLPLTCSAHCTSDTGENKKRGLNDLRSQSYDSTESTLTSASKKSSSSSSRGKYRCSVCGELKINHVCVGSDDVFSFSSVYIQTEQHEINLATGQPPPSAPAAPSPV